MYKHSYKKKEDSNIIYVKQDAELVEEFDPVLKVEKAGRTCYQSGSSGDRDKAVEFVQRALRMGHMSIFEHVVFCFVFPKQSGSSYYAFQLRESETNPDFEYTHYNGSIDIISINFRFLLEAFIGTGYVVGNERLAPLIAVVQNKYPELFSGEQQLYLETYRNEINSISLYTSDEFRLEFNDVLNKQEKLAHYYFSFVLQTDRGVMTELTRHRRNAFSVSSTRYINFDKKVGGVPIVEPAEGFKEDGLMDNILDLNALHYSFLLDRGLTAQEARAVLPQCLWTEIFTTANLRQWLHVFDLRLAEAAHPMIRELMAMVKELLSEYIGDED